MGQAKQRGTYEERKAAAIAKDKAEREILPRCKRRLSRKGSLLISIGLGLGFSHKDQKL